MIKLMIVDDEPFVRNALCRGIDWKSYGYTVVADCKNGREALEKIDLVHPDIVITDVRMPVMNGVELASELYRLYPEILVIMISGYEEFEYAKAAVDYGAFAYVLKPLDTEELLAVLQRAEKILRSKQRMNEFVVTDKTIYESVLRGTFQYDKYEEERELLEKLTKLYHVVVLVSAGEKMNQEASNFLLSFEQESVRCFDAINRGILILLRSCSIAKLQQEREVFCEGLREGMQKLCISGFCIAASSVKRGLDELLAAYYEAGNIEKMRYLIEDNAVYYSDHKYLVRYADMSMEAQHMVSVILRKNRKEIYGEINKQFEQFVLKHTSIYTIKDFAKAVMHQMVTKIEAVDFDEHVGDSIVQLYLATDLQDIREILRAFIDECLNYFNKTSELTTNAIIMMAKEYMMKNYQRQDLSLSDVADYVHLNPSYFSAVFSKYCKMTFINYLTKLRIQNAQEKLIYTDKKVSQIAFECGYLNFTYFCRSFKKSTGMQPKEFRDRYKK